MKKNMTETTPAAIKPVEDLAAQMEITPYKLRLAIGLAAAAKYTLDLGLGIQVKVEIIDEASLSDAAILELIHFGILDDETPDECEPQEMLWAAPAANGRIQ